MSSNYYPDSNLLSGYPDNTDICFSPSNGFNWQQWIQYLYPCFDFSFVIAPLSEFDLIQTTVQLCSKVTLTRIPDVSCKRSRFVPHTFWMHPAHIPDASRTHFGHLTRLAKNGLQLSKSCCSFIARFCACTVASRARPRHKTHLACILDVSSWMHFQMCANITLELSCTIKVMELQLG